MAGRRAKSHEDLRHFEGGVTSGRDLRVGRDDKGIRPGLLQMLFAGGRADRALAVEDVRMGRREDIRPRTGQMLFKGGPSRAVGAGDYRTGRDGGVEPDDEEMLSEGGEAEEGEAEEGEGDLTEEQLTCAEDMLESMGGFGYGDKISEEHDSEPEKAGKRASRRAKAEMFGQALKAFLLSMD